MSQDYRNHATLQTILMLRNTECLHEAALSEADKYLEKAFTDGISLANVVSMTAIALRDRFGVRSCFVSYSASLGVSKGGEYEWTRAMRALATQVFDETCWGEIAKEYLIVVAQMYEDRGYTPKSDLIQSDYTEHEWEQVRTWIEEVPA